MWFGELYPKCELRLTGLAVHGQHIAVLVSIALLVLMRFIAIVCSGDPVFKKGTMRMRIFNTVGLSVLETFWAMETNIVTSALPP